MTVLAPTPVTCIACWSDSPARTAGTFHRGERVYLIGRSADPSWAEVRSITNGTRHVELIHLGAPDDAALTVRLSIDAIS